ncbi:hypothetical protein BFR69_00020 [Acinetobacter pittii]|jgi:hypothetical protein|nr:MULTISPECIES: DUF3226 domain-containing protein [Acinetobacter]MDA1136615.1 hypothetical protein [Pseudomonadota bacterium]KQE24004.1 hypothetical protein APD39_19115 [Acinetobacter pittii]KQE24292.1 hypothetical protein APD38_06290 [Acinetobacter pittii]KRI80752.1 hypothetical protein APC68_11145 [Acinetobacter pittii]KRJ60851.1 hypothetical protein APC92_11340 [Acinetobacter pittii]
MKNLIVEGLGDKFFFERYCEHHKFDVDVTVITPEDVDSKFHTTKSGVIFNSLNKLLEQVSVGKITRLGIIVDADQEIVDSGIEKTKSDLQKILTPHGYTLENTEHGLVATNNDGLIDIGIWIMPDNIIDGTIEDWIENLVHTKEQDLFRYSKECVANLKTNNLQKFKDSRILKAELATWFAWQKSPGYGLDFFFDEPLIDKNSPAYNNLSEWFKRTFNI